MGARTDGHRASGATDYPTQRRGWSIARFLAIFGPRERRWEATMRKRMMLLVAALMMTLTMSFGSIAAFADTQACQDAQKNPKWDCKGNKLENPGGHSFLHALLEPPHLYPFR